MIAKNGAVITTFASSASQVYQLDLNVPRVLSIDATSAIDVSGEGYLPGYTTGNTTQGASTGSAAGSYGGLGGIYGSGTPNAVYGDYANPDDWGSGTSPGGGGTGGGLVRIAAGQFILDGQIRAQGSGDNMVAAALAEGYISRSRLSPEQVRSTPPGPSATSEVVAAAAASPSTPPISAASTPAASPRSGGPHTTTSPVAPARCTSGIPTNRRAR